MQWTFSGGHTVPPVTAHWKSQAYHLLRVAGHILGLLIDRLRGIGDTYHTYKYCHHLDQLDSFRGLFARALAADPARAACWSRSQVWIDHLPDLAYLSTLPKGSLGRTYFETMRYLEAQGYPSLRPKRLAALPHEARGLDRRLLERTTDRDELLELLISRRNIHMTSSHDFFHMLLGADTFLTGEALVARYQWKHLLVPQNWLNMKLSMAAKLILGNWNLFWRIKGNEFPIIDRSPDCIGYDWNGAWSKPIGDVRAELGLPRDGFMRGADLI
jgi:ubiquinone biosynthesis protein Coq4